MTPGKNAKKKEEYTDDRKIKPDVFFSFQN